MTLPKLEQQALNTLLKNELKYSKQIQQTLLDALTSTHSMIIDHNNYKTNSPTNNASYRSRNNTFNNFLGQFHIYSLSILYHIFNDFNTLFSNIFYYTNVKYNRNLYA